MTRVLDIILTAALVAVIVLAALLLLAPWQPDITEAVAVHDASRCSPSASNRRRPYALSRDPGTADRRRRGLPFVAGDAHPTLTS